MSRDLNLTLNQGIQPPLPSNSEMKSSQAEEGLHDIFNQVVVEEGHNFSPSETTSSISSSLHQWSNTLQRRDSMDDLWNGFDAFFEERKTPPTKDNPSTIASGLQFLSNLFSNEESEQEAPPSEKEIGIIAVPEDFDVMADLEYISQLARKEEEAIENQLFNEFEQADIASPQKVETPPSAKEEEAIENQLVNELEQADIALPQRVETPPSAVETIAPSDIKLQEASEKAPLQSIEEKPRTNAVAQNLDEDIEEELSKLDANNSSPSIKKEDSGSFIHNLFSWIMDALGRLFKF